jgi:uncharacterized protein (TIGR02001 family)
MASDYVFRGISQTDNQMALQGGFDYEHESGLYIGTWASNVDSSFFNTESSGSKDPQLEVDLYAGYSGSLTETIGYDLGYLRYQYPGYSNAGTNEWYASGSYSTDGYGDLSLKINYSPDLNWLPSNQSAWYLDAGYETTLPWYEIGVSAHFGYSFGDAFDVSSSSNDYGYHDTYTDWSLGVSKSVYGVDLGLTYVDQDLSSDDKCGKDYCKSKFVASISKSF